jgi:hypothetical protein
MAMSRTVIVAFGNAEARRYEIHHAGHDGPGGYTHPRDEDYFIAAKRLLIGEGFDSKQVAIASYRFG